MLVPLSWLREYVDISGIPVQELRKKMSSSGLAVERQHIVGDKLENIIIGQIVEMTKHPDSDHLWACLVKLQNEDQKETVQIVTGAQNIFKDAKIPVILSGDVLPDGSKIETTLLRGVESNGMMCSEKELGLGESHEGIMILDNDATVGQKLIEYLGLPDVVFDIEVTSNRGDCLSMVGIAREVATLFSRTLKWPELKTTTATAPNSTKIKVEIEDQNKCMRFSAGLYDGFVLGNSPIWMQQRLLRAGMRPINNIVDISNYVMLELGQPTHAYDASQISDMHFIVRTAKTGEELQTLDKKQYKLEESMLLIADPTKNLGVAGIMGGDSSKITDQTHTLILEAANFDPINIRRTGMKLGIRSDAIIRFERGVDPELVAIAMKRINYLLSKYTRANLSSDLVDVYLNKAVTVEVSLASKKLEIYLGKRITLGESENILNGLGFNTIGKTDGGAEWIITVSVPSWRSRDVSIEEDLIEEVARMHGYDNIPMIRPTGEMPIVVSNKRLKIKKLVLESMKSNNYQEILTYSFNSRSEIEMSGYKVEQALEMVSPLSEEHRYMRLSLLPNLLSVLNKNTFLGREIKIFELSSVYHRFLYPILPDEAVGLALEPIYFSGLIGGKDYNFEYSYKNVLGVIESVFNQVGIKKLKLSQDKTQLKNFPSHEMFHPGRVGLILLENAIAVGLFGEIHPSLQERLGQSEPCFMFEIQFQPIVEATSIVSKFNQYSIYPATTEAISFIMDDKVNVGEIVDALSILDQRISEISVGKPYKGDQIARGMKAVTLTFVFQLNDGSISEKISTEIREKIVRCLETKFSVKVRS